MIATRALSAVGFRVTETRRLVAWALEHGATEFTIEVMAIQGVAAPLADSFEDLLEPWAIEPAPRRTLSGASGTAAVRVVRLWRLTPVSAELLNEFLPDGLFGYDVQERGWFENPIIYRGGEILCGVISHEREGYLRVSSDEAAGLLRLGIPLGATLQGVEP